MAPRIPPKHAHPDSVWRCPCGYEGPYYKAIGHRHNARHRPECASGPLVQVGGPGLDDPTAPHVMAEMADPQRTPTPPAVAPPGDISELGQLGMDNDDDNAPFHDGASVFEYTGLDATDAEAIARQLLNQRRGGVPPEGGDLGDGDWSAEFPPGPQSQAREVVYLPIVVRIMYDWCRANGWLQGDGSLSAFVTDMVLCHWVQCMGKAVVVVDREEVGLNGRRA